MREKLGRLLRRREDRRRSRTALGAIALVAGVLGAGAAGTVAWSGAMADPVTPHAERAAATQRYSVGRAFTLPKPQRDRFIAAVVAAADDDGGDGAVTPVGEAQKFAAKMVDKRGWEPSEFGCLVSLWNRESGWNVHAAAGSGAYGIPQAYPGSKMAVGGGDWRNDHEVQIRWGLGYIAGRYGTPCGAWAHFQSAGSY